MYRIRIPIGLAMLAVIGGIGYFEFHDGSLYLSTSLISLLIFASAWELYALLKNRDAAPYLRFGLTAIFWGLVLNVFSVLFPSLDRHRVLAFYECMVIVLLMVYALSETRTENVLERTSSTLLGFVYIYFLLGYLIKIRGLGDQGEGVIYVLYLVLVAKSMDIGGYLVGKAIGKHKIAPSISPKKSWEGFFGGLLLSVFAAWFLAHRLPFLREFFSWPYALLFGIVVSILSFLGDLSESLLKRRCHVKDSGTLIPEFGGILDLLDSLIFAAPWGYYFLASVLDKVRP